MSSHHPLGKREEKLYVRLHRDEQAQLAVNAARHGLSKADYARKRLLEEPIPPLPTVIPPSNIAALALVKQIYTKVGQLHLYCGTSGPINWSGQVEHGARIYDDIEAIQKELVKLNKHLHLEVRRFP